MVDSDHHGGQVVKNRIRHVREINGGGNIYLCYLDAPVRNGYRTGNTSLIPRQFCCRAIWNVSKQSGRCLCCIFLCPPSRETMDNLLVQQDGKNQTKYRKEARNQ